jgi:PRTRC genetic system protein C
MQISAVKRVFRYSGLTLPDPEPRYSPDEVRQFYARQHPELTTAVVEGPQFKADTQEFTFRKAAGTKG